MTSHPFTNGVRPPSRLRDLDDDAGLDNPSANVDEHAGDKGTRIVSMALLGLTVAGAIGMLGMKLMAS